MGKRSKHYVNKIRKQLTADPRLYDATYSKIALAKVYGVDRSVVDELLTNLIMNDIKLFVVPVRITADKYGVSQRKVTGIRSKWTGYKLRAVGWA